MDCASPLAGRAEVSVQLLKPLGATSTPPARGAASYNLERRGGNSGRPLLMLLCGITLVPLAEELRVADLGILSPFYADDVALENLAQTIAQILKMLMERGPDWGYLSETAKYLFILDTPGQEGAVGESLLQRVW